MGSRREPLVSSVRPNALLWLGRPERGERLHAETCFFTTFAESPLLAIFCDFAQTVDNVEWICGGFEALIVSGCVGRKANTSQTHRAICHRSSVMGGRGIGGLVIFIGILLLINLLSFVFGWGIIVW